MIGLLPTQITIKLITNGLFLMWRCYCMYRYNIYNLCVYFKNHIRHHSSSSNHSKI